MVIFGKRVYKYLEKGKLPHKIFKTFHNAFLSLDLTKDFTLFDITTLKKNSNSSFYRLKKGKYRAIFETRDNNIVVHIIATREEVYKLWEQLQ